VAARNVEYYNTVRLHSAIIYVTPLTRLESGQRAIFDARDRKLDAARQRRAHCFARLRAIPRIITQLRPSRRVRKR
jgi:putative transposase